MYVGCAMHGADDVHDNHAASKLCQTCNTDLGKKADLHLIEVQQQYHHD